MNENPMISMDKSEQLPSQEVPIDLSSCKYCKSTGLNEDDKFCFNCRFPIGNDDREKRRYFYGVKLRTDKITKKKKAIKKARNILFILAGINFLYGIIMGMLVHTDGLVLIVSLIGTGIYFSLGMWSRAKPFPAFLTGFYIFIVFTAMAVIEDPHTIYRGLLWKGIIIYAFVAGYKAVKDSVVLENELDKLKVPTNLIEDDGM